MRKWAVLESSYLLQSRFGSLRRDKCLLPNGAVIDGYSVNEYPEWANVVAVTRDDEIVLIKQYRHGAVDFFIEIPGGTTEDGEAADAAIVRELAEETGYVSDRAPLLIGDLHTNPANATNRVKTFLVLDAYKALDQHTDETEQIEVLLVPFAQVEEMIRKGEITQLFTVAAYYLAKEQLQRAT